MIICLLLKFVVDFHAITFISYACLFKNMFLGSNDFYIGSYYTINTYLNSELHVLQFS